MTNTKAWSLSHVNILIINHDWHCYTHNRNKDIQRDVQIYIDPQMLRAAENFFLVTDLVQRPRGGCFP